MSRERARFRGSPFPQIAVAANTNKMLIEDAMVARVESRRRHFHRHRDAGRITDALAERPGRAFDTGCLEKFRVPRSFGMQLPETFDLRHRQIVAAQVKPSVKEHAAVPGGENEVIAIDPARLDLSMS